MSLISIDSKVSAADSDRGTISWALHTWNLTSASYDLCPIHIAMCHLIHATLISSQKLICATKNKKIKKNKKSLFSSEEIGEQ